MEAILGTCCGLDVHRDEIVACLMKGPLDCKPTTEIKTFSALQHDLKKLKEWLEKEGCHNVAMESTGIYSPERRPLVPFRTGSGYLSFLQ